MSHKIRIKLKSHDVQLVDHSVERITKAVKLTGVKIIGPIPLPSVHERYTVNRSPHVNKKSREQFVRTTYKRLLDIQMATTNKSHDVLDALMKIELQAGVEVDIKG